MIQEMISQVREEAKKRDEARYRELVALAAKGELTAEQVIEVDRVLTALSLAKEEFDEDAEGLAELTRLEAAASVDKTKLSAAYDTVRDKLAVAEAEETERHDKALAKIKHLEIQLRTALSPIVVAGDAKFAAAKLRRQLWRIFPRED